MLTVMGDLVPPTVDGYAVPMPYPLNWSSAVGWPQMILPMMTSINVTLAFPLTRTISHANQYVAPADIGHSSVL